MGRIIAVANQKGGVGKTTTAINLSACLAEKGKKVLSVDMDPQGNMTSGLGMEKGSVQKTIYNLIIGEANVEEYSLLLMIPCLLLPLQVFYNSLLQVI